MHRRLATALLGLVLLALAVWAVAFAVRAGPLVALTRGVARFLLGQGPERGAMRLTPVSAHVDQGLPVPLVLGYYYDPSGRSGDLAHYASILNGLVPFWYTIHGDGSVTGSADPAVLSFAARHHLWVFALIQNMTGAGVYHALLNNAVARARAMENLLGLCEAEGYDGVNLDFEGIAPEDRAAYTRFVADLTALFHENGYYVTLSVPAETADEPSNGWTGAYDYRALGRAADLIMIMAYDEHSVGSSAGPIADPHWVEAVIRYASRTVDPAKVILGLPAYGYDWPADGAPATAISWWQWQQLVEHYDPQSPGVGHLQYWDQGVLHEVYYENLASFLDSLRLAVGYNLRGIVLWRLGIEDPSIWPYLGAS